MDASVARLAARRAIVVGDRLDTDLEGARRAGLAGLLVLTGVTDVATLLSAAPAERPDYLGAELDSLMDRHRAPVREGARGSSPAPVCAPGWTAPAGSSSPGEPGGPGADGRRTALAAVRLACAALWSGTGDGAGPGPDGGSRTGGAGPTGGAAVDRPAGLGPVGWPRGKGVLWSGPVRQRRTR